jgi:hypothetical protein
MRRLYLAHALLLLAAVAPTLARADEGRVSFGNDITVREGESANDIACAFCTVRVHGSVKGDIAVLFGSVTVDDNQSVSGDVAILGGDLELHGESTVGGDVAIAAGSANLGQGATIRGDRMVLPGRLWLLLPFAPILILVGIIWLIVYFVRRNRYPYPVYPQGPVR